MSGFRPLLQHHTVCYFIYQVIATFTPARPASTPPSPLQIPALIGNWMIFSGIDKLMVIFLSQYFVGPLRSSPKRIRNLEPGSYAWAYSPIAGLDATLNSSYPHSAFDDFTAIVQSHTHGPHYQNRR